MKRFARYAFSIGAAAVFLAGCTLRQAQDDNAQGNNAQGDGELPIGVQGGMQESRPETASSYQVLYRFDRYPNGEQPLAALTDVGGVLYGTASDGGVKGCHHRGGCGTFFSITPNGTEKLLYDFTTSTGVYPISRLIDAKGTLYGTTYQGGPSAKGTVYRISTMGSESVLYNFRGLHDGAYPDAGVTYANGTFYGTNTYGGGRDGGTAYSVSSSGVHTVLHHFFGGYHDGYDPESGLINVKGTLYGTTKSGGGQNCRSARQPGTHIHYGCGIVYSLTTSGKMTILHRFGRSSTDGRFPEGDLLDVNGTLYGTTFGGGGTACSGFGCGTVYSMTTSGAENVLYRFTGGADGQHPAAGVIDVNGTLYGTTAEGGNAPSCYCGTVYSLTTSGVESVLHSFAGGTDGMHPQAPLTPEKGTLYGTTVYGGELQKGGNCCGTIFALTP